jgi:hypothetical protein
VPLPRKEFSDEFVDHAVDLVGILELQTPDMRAEDRVDALEAVRVSGAGLIREVDAVAQLREEL